MAKAKDPFSFGSGEDEGEGFTDKGFGKALEGAQGSFGEGDEDKEKPDMDEEAMEILERVASGDLSAEDALADIKNLYGLA
jgi:hypothetical protein